MSIRKWFFLMKASLIKNSAKYIHANMNIKECLNQEGWMQRMKTSPNLMSQIIKLTADDTEAMKHIEKERRYMNDFFQ